MKRILVLVCILACVSAGRMVEAGETQTPAEGTAATPESQEVQTLSLFNGEDLEGWHIYLKDPDIDPRACGRFGMARSGARATPSVSFAPRRNTATSNSPSNGAGPGNPPTAASCSA